MFKKVFELPLEERQKHPLYRLLAPETALGKGIEKIGSIRKSLRKSSDKKKSINNIKEDFEKEREERKSKMKRKDTIELPKELMMTMKRKSSVKSSKRNSIASPINIRKTLSIDKEEMKMISEMAKILDIQ